MNHPLTAADRLHVQKGHFYCVGPDGAPNTADDERVQLFGLTFFFGKTVTDPVSAPKVAKRLRRLGVDLVRVPSGFFVDKGKPFPTLDDAAVARFQVWLDALTAEGIYLDLILHNTGYTFKPGRDSLPTAGHES